MEGPSLLILREELRPFQGQKVLNATGNTHQPKETLLGTKLETIDTWGKHLFLIFTRPKTSPIVTKTHFLMFGSYRINDPRVERSPRLELTFKNGKVYFYSCSLRFDGDVFLSEVDRRTDIMSTHWDVKHVAKVMGEKKKMPLCDLFLDQKVFTGSGNIIKNEVLFNIRCHPLTTLSQISRKDWPKLAKAVRGYGWNFHKWKKKYQLRAHWQVYSKGLCPLCKGPIKRQHLGTFPRRTFWCPVHQHLGDKRQRLEIHKVLPIKRRTPRERRFNH